MTSRPGLKEGIFGAFFIFQVVLVVLVYVIGDYGEVMDPDLSMEVGRTWTVDEQIDGITPVEGKVWQLVEVEITNNNEEEPIEIMPWHFFAIDNDGERIWPFNSDTGPTNSIDPGGTDNLLLIFDIEKGSRLVEMEYIKRTSSPLKFSIPETH